jgi:hypothetical protein
MMANMTAKGLDDDQQIETICLEKPFADQLPVWTGEEIFSDNEHRCHVFQFAGLITVSAMVIEFALGI